MFDNSTLEAYRSITAPSGLRERVVSSVEAVPVKVRAKRSGLRPFHALGYAVAACLVLAASLWGMAGGGAAVTVNLPAEYGVSLARELPTEEVGLELCQRGFCRVSVSEGVLSSENKSGEELVLFGNESLVWQIRGDGIQSAELRIIRAGGEKLFLLQKNADSGEWIICPAEIINR